MRVNMHEAKSKLSQLVEAVNQGEEVIIAKSGKPVAQLIPYKEKVARQFGTRKGKVKMAEDFDSQKVNREISDMFGGK